MTYNMPRSGVVGGGAVADQTELVPPRGGGGRSRPRRDARAGLKARFAETKQALESLAKSPA